MRLDIFRRSSVRTGIAATAFAAATVVMFQNCAPETFSVMTKNRKLSGSPVFAYAASGTISVVGGSASGAIPGAGGANGNITTGDGRSPGSAQGEIADQTTPGMPTLPGLNSTSGSIPVTTTVAVPIQFGCSTRRSQEQGNVAGAKSLTVRLSTSMDDSSQAACSFTDPSLRETILQSKKIPLSLVDKHCPTLANGKYYVFVSDTEKTTDLNWSEGDAVSVIKSASSWQIQENDFLTLVTDFNDEFNGGRQAMLVLKPEDCDVKASPLMVRLETPGTLPGRLILSSPSNGVLFDILGANARPVPYTPTRISWMRNSPQFHFVTLPNSNGEVKGVDQLFGDNTKGPDGQFAANGFAALAKYDSNNDGFITDADPVFAKLRMWRDQSGDAIAQASELHALARLGITSIDLRYDPHYHEADAYGNEIKFKSVVRTSDGRLHIIFDLWFAYK